MLVNPTRFLTWVAAAAMLAMGCSSPPPAVAPDGGACTGLNCDCFEDEDCPDPSLFFCNRNTAKCEPACHTRDQCKAEVRGDYKLDYCEGTLGCQCDEGKCVPSLCSADSDCGASLVCRNGACVQPPAASAVASCTVVPDFAVARSGAKMKFSVLLRDASGQPVVVSSGIEWTATHAAVAGTPGTGIAAEFSATGAGTSAPVDGVQAKVGAATCKAKVVVLPATVLPAHVAVSVIDELTGRPISGATVLVSNPSTGDPIVGGNGTTNAVGYLDLAVTGATAVTVSVFHPDYAYLTIPGYDLSSSSGEARLLSFVLRRNQVDKYGGYKGTFTDVPQTANVHAGIAGMSIAGSVTDLSLAQLLGPSIPKDVKLGTIDQKGVPIPAGAYLAFSENNVKTDFSAQGLAGTCSDEAKVLAGTCGTRTAWALSGDVPVGDLPINAFTGGTSNIKFDEVLSKVIPVFKKFNSSVVRDVEFGLRSTPRDSVSQEPNFSDTSSFTTQNHPFNQLPLGFNFVVRAPDLPKFKGSFVDGVLVLTGAVVPGRGVVPLGLGAGVNTNNDNKTDLQAELPAPGLISTRMAPTHHGLEGSEYGALAMAVSLKSATDSSAGFASSAVFGRMPANRLEFDPKGTLAADKQVDLSKTSGFLGFPEGAKYNFVDEAQGDLGKRTFKFARDPGLSGVSAVRVVFTDAYDRHWTVLLDPSKSTTDGFTLPKPPGAFGDRTFAWNSATSVRSNLLVQLLKLNDNPRLSSTGTLLGQPLGFNRLVELNSTNPDRMVEFTTAFSFVDYARPTVAFVDPARSGQSVNAGTIKVQVTSFKVGTSSTDDGYVKLTFTGGSASCAAGADGKVDTSQGKGEISITVPSGCNGSNVTIKATLYDNTNNPLKPEASSTITANIP